MEMKFGPVVALHSCSVAADATSRFGLLLVVSMARQLVC